MQKIKILVAEDTKVARDLIIEGLQNYALTKFGDENYFFIERAESFQKGLQKLAESEKAKLFYDVFFTDIDFSEDNRGGARDSGYKLIEKAFEVCPVTKIYTYSGQFHAKDLWLKYEYLKQRGLIIQGMDKSHAEGGEEAWLNENLDKIIDKLSSENYLLNIWQNHQLVLDTIRKEPYFNSTKGILKFYEIQSNLESILVLLKSIKSICADVILYRLILQLYHRCLEIYLSQGSDDEIISQSDMNKTLAENLLRQEKLLGKEADGTDRSLILGDRSSALRKIVAYSTDNKLKYGYLMNKYRNKSVHPDSIFEPELTNVIFSNLSLSLYVLAEKNAINYQLLESALNEGLFKGRGEKDLVELIGYLKNN